MKNKLIYTIIGLSAAFIIGAILILTFFNRQAILTPQQAMIELNKDSDADGISDALEADLGFDQTKADTDGNGISDGDELSARVETVATPAELAPINREDKTDSDQDGYADNVEIFYGINSQTATTDEEFRAAVGRKNQELIQAQQ